MYIDTYKHIYMHKYYVHILEVLSVKKNYRQDSFLVSPGQLEMVWFFNFFSETVFLFFQ